MDLQIVLMTVIAVCAVLSFVSGVSFVLLKWALAPLKEGQIRLETELKADIKDLKNAIQEIQKSS